MPSDPFVVNVEGAVFKDDRWLMIQRSDKEAHAAGRLSMVGGTVDYADSQQNVLESGLLRELDEEVGVVAGTPMTYLESKSFLSDANKWVIDIVFMAPYASGEPAAIDADEVAWVGWLTLAEIEQHPATPPWIVQSMRLAEKARSAAG
jgi:8-oxo-dGTP diphosphatase